MEKDLKDEIWKKQELLKKRQRNEVLYLWKRTKKFNKVYEERQRPGRKVRTLEKELERARDHISIEP